MQPLVERKSVNYWKMGHTYYIMGIVLLVWSGLAFGVTLQENPARELIVETGDSNPLTLTIVDSGGDPTIPDVTVSGATYLDIAIITGRTEPEDEIEVAIDAATTWDLTGPHSGTVTIEDYSAITFSGIDGLVGADDEDTFVLHPAAGFDGALDGGSGINTLDYSTYTASIIVNLTTPTATGATGIINIQGVIGGKGSDTITGDSQDNFFTGGPGKDIITGKDGFDTVVETRDADFALTDTSLTIGSEGLDKLIDIEAAILTGGSGDNTLNATSFGGPVVLDGAGGDDTLWGGSKDDVLIGGAGNNTIDGKGGVDTVIETCDADFDLTVSGQLSWIDNKDTFDNIENFHLIGGPTENLFDISVSALEGASVLVEGDAGKDILTLEASGFVVHLTSGEISIDPGPQFVNYETVELASVDGLPTAEPGGPYLAAVNTQFTVDGSASSDPDGDSLTYAWTLDDTLQGDGVAPSFVAPNEPGIYPLDLIVDDSDQGTAEASTSVVVYDSSAGFVTGGGWIDSPEGAYANDLSMIGEATFGFVSKYKKGATVPTGSTEFEFQAGDLIFHSTSYEWLIVNGSNYAKFKGSGTINGLGNYKFMLWAGDGEPDTFRIRIWEEGEATGDEIDIYDNGSEQAISGGSIVVHAKEK